MRLQSINKELLYNTTRVNLDFDNQDRMKVLEWLNSLSIKEGADYTIEIKQKYDKRSLSMNSYYWVLVGKIADVLGAEKTRIHNKQLSKYGALLTDKDGNVLYTLCKASIDFEQYEDIHMRPTGKTEDRNGVTYAWFMLLKPSHEYDSAEMKALIDGTVQDAQELGVETMTPEEIAHLRGMGIE